MARFSYAIVFAACGLRARACSRRTHVLGGMLERNEFAEEHQSWNIDNAGTLDIADLGRSRN